MRKRIQERKQKTAASLMDATATTIKAIATALTKEDVARALDEGEEVRRYLLSVCKYTKRY